LSNEAISAKPENGRGFDEVANLAHNDGWAVVSRLEEKRSVGSGRHYVVMIASILLASCVAEEQPPDPNASAAKAPTEIIIRNATGAPVEYGIMPTYTENETKKVLGAGSIDRHETDIALDISFESGGKRLLYQLDPGKAYAFRMDLHDNLALYFGTHTREDAPDLAPFVPTPKSIVEKMLVLSDIDENDLLIDLGCGDGRIVIEAARKYGARGIGVDIDPQLIDKAIRLAKAAGVARLVEFRVQDATKTDLSSATVVSLYLTPRANELIRPRLEQQLKPGSRVVTHDYPILTWKAAREESVQDGGRGRIHRLYLYHR
jgi:SAM-dependent methyltransferase